MIMDDINAINKDFIFFIDDAHNLINESEEHTETRRQLAKFIDKLLKSCKRTKVIMTVRKEIGSTSHPPLEIKLEGMKGGKQVEDRKAALDLFQSSYIQKYPDEVNELLDTLPDYEGNESRFS
jgi:hypothetical protein